MKTDVHGNTAGLRDAVIASLQALYSYEAESFLPRELMQTLARLSGAINREIALYLTRDGEVVDVSVGTDSEVELQDFRLRRSTRRLSCVRCVHTHPNGDGRLSDVDLSALKTYRYDAMVAVGCKAGEPTWVQAAFLRGAEEPLISDPARWYRLPEDDWEAQVAASDALMDELARQDEAVRPSRERVVLMGIESEESLAELARLAETAGAEVAGAFLQKRDKPDSALFIGKGRAEQLALDCQALEADTCVFDDELSGIQARNLETLLRVKVIDRTMLILDIFAQRATSAEGKTQVELAQLQYRAARLVGLGAGLSRLAGGIGTRGPGESRLEIDRRRVRSRITELKRRLDELEKQRGIRRKSRERREVPVAALVGYTNAGKSSLLNALTGAGVYVQDQLFATLDTVGRRVEAPGQGEFLLMDTVGFIRKLPHTLVSAFRSTLEEAAQADALILVSDGASPDRERQRDTVEQVLAELGAVDQPRLEVLNKCDLPGAIPFLPGMLAVSAKTGEGLDELKKKTADLLRDQLVPATFFLPYSRYGEAQAVRRAGKLLSEENTEEGVRITVALSPQEKERLEKRLGQRG